MKDVIMEVRNTQKSLEAHYLLGGYPECTELTVAWSVLPIFPLPLMGLTSDLFRLELNQKMLTNI
jgi:hypothetical protein